MKKYQFLLLFAIIASPLLYAQKDSSSRKLSKAESEQLMKTLNVDSSSFLKNSGESACHCIDSIYGTTKDKSKLLEGFSGCIDKEVTGYDLAVKLLNQMTGKDTGNVINVSTNQASVQYKRRYFEIERWLRTNCHTINTAMASNDEMTDHSFSQNKAAREAYGKGDEYLQAENFKEAIPWFEKAVQIDSVFSFAWDNLAICYRKTGAYDKALLAYQTSLRLDPSGKTALINIAVVYSLLKKPDEAINAYQNLLHYYPDDPETYYGISLIYVNQKNDLEKGLDYMCKAYNLYLAQKSPYRSDAEKTINYIYGQLKKQNKEDVFSRILKENNISSN